MAHFFCLVPSNSSWQYKEVFPICSLLCVFIQCLFTHNLLGLHYNTGFFLGVRSENVCGAIVRVRSGRQTSFGRVSPIINCSKLMTGTAVEVIMNIEPHTSF